MSQFNINEDAQSGGEYSGSQSSSNNERTSQQPAGESAFPDEDEETITMMDVLEREDKLEEEASAVLGNSDEKNCTYPRGYVARQALYSCATCSEGSDKIAAICLACSLECHDNHELFELYTKRNYRCDCGNSKFKENFECKLMDKQTKKAPINENNKYNHNFVGKYCTCDKRYPPDENDTSAESNDEMYQCIVCEDWYHGKHLGVEELPSKFDELICSGCVQKLDFVHYYRDIDKIDELHNNCTSSNIVVESSKTTNVAADNKAEPAGELEPEASSISAKDASVVDAGVVDAASHQGSKRDVDSQKTNSSTTLEAKPSVSESDTNDSQVENKDPTNTKRPPEQQAIGKDTTDTTSANDCILARLKAKELATDDKSETNGQSGSVRKSPTSSKMATIFWTDCSWRAKLCKCHDCMSMYRKKECEYLLEEKDTVEYYEAQGKVLAKDRATPFERGMTALNSMGNRAAVVEALHGYDELKADLSSYLRKFADTKQVVRESDIHDFFAQLKSKKRPRLEYE